VIGYNKGFLKTKGLTLDRETHRAAAKALDHANATQTVLPLLSAAHPEMNITDGYAIQQCWADLRIARGERLVGYKVGFTSHAMQKAYNVAKPLCGRLFDSMVWETGALLSAQRFFKLHVEVELAFIIGRDLAGSKLTIADVLSATDFIQPALELIDYRTVTPRSIADMVADNTACAGAVLGGHRVPPSELNLGWAGATLAKNGDIVETGLSAAVLGHPANALIALSEQLASEGQWIKAGDIILSGAFMRIAEVTDGDTICADFGVLGKIDLTVAQ
jgi:2-oxo-hept-3-ene-1,7-dioate hydratase